MIYHPEVLQDLHQLTFATGHRAEQGDLWVPDLKRSRNNFWMEQGISHVSS